MSEFFAMGGYANYVWGSYGAAFLVLAANVIFPILKGRQIRTRLQRRISDEAGSLPPDESTQAEPLEQRRQTGAKDDAQS